MSSTEGAIRERVFGIGMNKTGTTSLKDCFALLGLLPIAPNSHASLDEKSLTRSLFEEGDYESALKFAEEYHSFEDRLWNVWEMYQRPPPGPRRDLP